MNPNQYLKKITMGGMLLLGWLFILYEYAIRVSDSVIIQPLMHSFNINSTQMGLLSSAYNITYILMQIPAGILIDRFGILKSWFFALVSVALGCYLFSISQSMLLAATGRALMGFGSAFAWVGIINIVCNLFAKKNHAFYIGVSMTLCMLGAVLGQEPWLFLTTQLGGWQKPYLMAAGIGAVLAILILVFNAKKLRTQQVMPERKLRDILISLKPILLSKVFWIFAFYITVISLPQNAFSALWAVEFFKQHYQFNEHLAATVVSAVWFGGIFGAPLIGAFSKNIANKKMILIIANVITLILTIFVIFIKIKSVFLVIALLFCLGFITNISVIIYAQASALGGERAGSTVVAAINMLNMGGAALVQIFMGYMLTITNPPHQLSNFSYSLSIMVVSLILSVGMLFFLKPKDIN